MEKKEYFIIYCTFCLTLLLKLEFTMRKILILFACFSFLLLTLPSCKKDVVGCTNPKAENYDPDANVQGDCIIKGCTNPKSENFNPQATVDDGSCVTKGCTNPKAENYNPLATVDDGFCIIKGCTNPKADNYDPEANVDNGSCIVKGCKDNTALNYDALATVDDGTCKYEKDLFIGNYTGVMACTNPLIQQVIANQSLDVIIEEIPGEKKKVKLSLGLQIPGLSSPTGMIEGRRLTYESPEQTVTIPIQGVPTEVVISNFGELNAGDDPKILNGTVTIKAKAGLFTLEDACSIVCTRK